LTQERWVHITQPANRPDMLAYEAELKHTIQKGHRTQSELNPQKYRYREAFADLPEDATHIVAIVLFRFRAEQENRLATNNYLVTAYAKEIG
jgi:hypothetical protein